MVLDQLVNKLKGSLIVVLKVRRICDSDEDETVLIMKKKRGKSNVHWVVVAIGE